MSAEQTATRPPARLQRLWRSLAGGESRQPAVVPAAPAAFEPVAAPEVQIAPNDPIIAYFQSVAGAVDIATLDLASPARDALVAAGVQLVVPLVSQGELIGLLNLGPRRSEQDYSGDDRSLLNNLAGHAAPALRVAQLVREQEAEIRTRERFEQEMRVAQLIQQQFLPKELPHLPGWQVAAHYQPARAVGGDFYDFIELPDGEIGIVTGDVTDKGVPAALVMASTRSILRSDAARLGSPAAVLARANELLYPDIPAHMFVTCFYGVLNPATGRFRYANAGHNLPYARGASDEEVVEYRATGMPLGLMPGMAYEEKEAVIAPGQTVLLYSDGLVEAHASAGEMFGFPRLKTLVGGGPLGSRQLIDRLLTELSRFTGANHEQEDDITLVTIQRSETASYAALDDGPPPPSPLSLGGDEKAPPSIGGRGGAATLADFTIASAPGNEREAMTRVAEAVAGLGLSGATLDRLKTAVAEATMNAIEHGNDNRPELPVAILVEASADRLSVRITDQGGHQGDIPTPETPDLDAKLAGLQTPRGWGLFLIEKMVDEMHRSGDAAHHTLELVVHLKGGGDGDVESD